VLDAVARGWSVFPVYPYSKRPAILDWPNRATTDLNQLSRWWAAAPYNIGIACGAASLVVLDLDADPIDGGEAGVEALALLAEHAAQTVPDTLTVATPSGGRHLYFTAPAGAPIRNSASRLGRRIDVRADGGYVLGAGSARRINGRRVVYRLIRDMPVAPIPGWITAALTTTAQTSVAAPSPIARADAYVQAAVAAETQAAAAAAVGTRNDRLFRAAGSLGELVGAGLLDHATATAALLAAAEVHVGVAGFTRTEAARAVANGLARGTRNPRVVAGRRPR
jgi:Bifunctional DNA primase/polymerase, N-terminal